MGGRTGGRTTVLQGQKLPSNPGEKSLRKWKD